MPQEYFRHSDENAGAGQRRWTKLHGQFIGVYSGRCHDQQFLTSDFDDDDKPVLDYKPLDPFFKVKWNRLRIAGSASAAFAAVDGV